MYGSEQKKNSHNFYTTHACTIRRHEVGRKEKDGSTQEVLFRHRRPANSQHQAKSSMSCADGPTATSRRAFTKSRPCLVRFVVGIITSNSKEATARSVPPRSGTTAPLKTRNTVQKEKKRSGDTSLGSQTHILRLTPSSPQRAAR